MDPISVYLIQFVVGLAFSTAVNLAQQAFSTKQEAGKAAIRGFRGQYSFGGTTPLKIVLGTYGVPGHLEYRNVWGNDGETPNAFLVDVLSISDYVITGVTAAWVDTQKVTLPGTDIVTPGYPVPQYNSGGKNHLYYRFRDGTQTTAMSYLTGKFGSDAVRPWESSMVGEGIAQAVMTARVSDKLWSGWPTYMFEVQGAPVFDPRLSAAAGGSGSQVWGTFSTYAFSDNPIVLIYNILRGLHDADGNHIWGGHATAYQLPFDVWAAAMDRCDGLVDKKGGGTEKRYRAGIEVSVSERPTDIIRELLIACNGRIGYHKGQYFVLVDVPEEADGSFTDVDVLASEPIRHSLSPNLDEVVNGATATFMAPGRAWEAKETAPYYRSDLEAEDGNRRLLQSLTLRAVFSGSQAQRILKAVVEESRRFKSQAVALPPAFDAYRPMQVLSWTSEEFQYEDKLWLITGKSVDEWGTVYLALQEIDPNDFSWDAETDETLISYAPLTPVVVPSQAVAGWFVEKYTDGVKPGIHLQWVGSLEDIGWAQVLIRLEGELLAFFDREFPYDEEHDTQDIYILGDPLRPLTDYEVSARFVPKNRGSRPTEWTTWYAVTTDDVPGIDIPPIEVIMLGKELANAHGLLTGTDAGSVQSQLAEYQAEAEELALAYLDSLATSRGKIDILQVQKDSAVAAVISVQKALVSETEARVQSINEIVASLGSLIAGGYIDMQAIVNSTASTATVTIGARATAVATATPKLMIKAAADGSGGTVAQVGVLGDLWVFNPDGSGAPAFGVADNKVKIHRLESFASIGGQPVLVIDGDAGDITFKRGRLQSDDGKFMIDVTNKRIRMLL